MGAQREGEISLNHTMWEKGNTGRDATEEKVFELSLKDTQGETSRLLEKIFQEL